MKLSFPAALGLLLLFACGQASAEDPRGFRLIGVPSQEHGYKNFRAQVISSQKQLDAFLKQVAAQKGWNARLDFLKALTNAKFDFARESLVLIRHTEGSGANEVTFAAPELKGEKLVCALQVDVAMMGTGDVADYCYAVAVEKGKAKQAEVWLNFKGAPKANRPREVLAIPAK